MKQTRVFNTTSNYPIKKKDFSETDKLVFDFFQAISKESYKTLCNFVVFIDSDADLVKIFFCDVVLGGYGIGDIQLRLSTIKKSPKSVREHLHNCMVSSIVKNAN